MAAFYENPLFIIMAIIIVAIVVIFKYYRGKGKFTEFKPKKLRDTLYEELKGKVKTQGMKLKKGKVLLSVNKIADIHKWINVRGEFTPYYFEEDEKKIIVDDEADKEKYDLLIFECKSKNILLRIINVKKWYLIIDRDSISRFDEISNTFVLKEGTDLMPFGNVWVNSKDGTEYLHNISIKKMNVEILSALENYPAKVVHLEMEQAKKERSYWKMMETDKSRYDAIKKAEDTVIS